MSNDDLTHENFDFRGFDVPDLKAVTLASSSDGDQSKQPKTKHEDASKNRKHGKKKSKSDARSWQIFDERDGVVIKYCKTGVT